MPLTNSTQVALRQPSVAEDLGLVALSNYPASFDGRVDVQVMIVIILPQYSVITTLLELWDTAKGLQYRK
jgi:hypothetical protein